MEFYNAHSEERLDKNFEMHFDDERPPIYNAEDYALHLRKYSKVPGLQLYGAGKETGQGRSKSRGKGGRRSESADPPAEGFSEMALRQFSTVSQLLQKLRTDLHLSYHSFLKEFIADPNDGVTLLLEVLKLIQLSQTSNTGGKEEEGAGKHQVLRRALSDEHQALLCLKLCSEVSNIILLLLPGRQMYLLLNPTDVTQLCSCTSSFNSSDQTHLTPYTRCSSVRM